MEENSAFDNFEMQLTDASKGFLRETAKWAYFLSIVGFVMLGFLVLIALFAGTLFAAMGSAGGPGMGALGAMGATFITIMYLIIAVVYFFPIYYLFKFSSTLKSAFRENDTARLTASLEYLKSHYKFIGILTIIGLSIYALFFIIGILGMIMT